MKAGVSGFFAYILSSLLFSVIGTLILIFNNVDTTPIIVLVSSILLTIIYIPLASYVLHKVEKKYLPNDHLKFFTNIILAVIFFSIFHIGLAKNIQPKIASNVIGILYFSSPVFLCLALKYIFEHFFSALSKCFKKIF